MQDSQVVAVADSMSAYIAQQTIDALNNAQAIIEFELDGTIITANDNFLKTLGYTLEEVQGEHHRIFCEPEYASSDEYVEFWEHLRDGKPQASEFRRYGKGNKEIWINASYNPIFDTDGHPEKVIKFATDITESRNRNAEFEAKINAINRVQAVIEFCLDGTIIDANENFLAVTGYKLDEIQGLHHRIFCDPEHAASPEYKKFWQRLSKGEFVAGEFQRVANDGSTVWINASYNPVFNASGNPTKIVKYATDITEQVRLREKAEILSLVADETDNSVVICDADGQIEYCNAGFTKLTGYTLDECRGQKPGSLLQGEHTCKDTVIRIREKLKAGEPFYDEILNYNRSGESYWISLAINPVCDSNGQVQRFISIQTNITEVKLQQLEVETKLEAISRTTAIIEFDTDGNVLTANSTFEDAMGYKLDEIKGKHHRMFCTAEEVASVEYQQFWEKLGRGEFEIGKYERVKKDGSPIYLNASYNPIHDHEGHVTKLIKFATDCTAAVEVEQEVRDIAIEFSEKAKQISDDASTVATGAQSLGATTEEMNASIEELSASIDSIALNGKSANAIAIATQQEAEQGAKSIEKSIDAMDLINDSSEKIAEIVKVISEIASQTNLLAFNAAIEAARAGEHGLGFSVVADEVRKLAERSSGATKDISKLINESVKRVGQGSEISKEAAKSFEKIVEGVNRTTSAISEISVAAEEQQSASRDVAHAVQQVADATEESASSSDSIANATTELAHGADKLRLTVQKFAK